jgi:hypothetical protein
MLRGVYHEYGWDKFPRHIGAPKQFEAKSFEDLINLFVKDLGKEPIYISHNAYRNNVILYENMAFDFDVGLEEAAKDCIKWCEYFDGYSIKINYTGGKIQSFLQVEPFVSLFENINVKKFESKVKKELGLETLDMKCAESKRLVRAIGSNYIRVKKVGNYFEHMYTDKYTIPITVDDLSDLDNVKEMSENQIYTHINTGGKRYKIKEEILSTKEYIPDSTTISDMDWFSLPEQMFLSVVKNIVNLKTILFDKLLTDKPDHLTRLNAAIAIKSFGISEHSSKQIFARISDIAHWTNRNLQIQAEQIHSIYELDYKLEDNNAY